MKESKEVEFHKELEKSLKERISMLERHNEELEYFIKKYITSNENKNSCLSEEELIHVSEPVNSENIQDRINSVLFGGSK